MMIVLLFTIFEASFANQNLSAVHYSEVKPGINRDEAACEFQGLYFNVTSERYSASLVWDCKGCSINNDGESVEINNRYVEPTLYNISIEINLIESQHVR